MKKGERKGKREDFFDKLGILIGNLYSNAS